MNIVIQAVISSLAIGGIYALLALGYTIIFSTMKMSHFAQGDFFMIGTFFAYTFLNLWSMSFIPAFLLAILSCMVVMLVVERCVYRSMYKSSNIYIIMCTLGVGIVLRNLAQLIWGSETFAFTSPFSQTPIELKLGGFTLSVVPLYLWIIGICAALMIVLHIFLKYSKVGTAMRAVSMNRDAAMLCGVKLERIIAVTYIIAAVLAAVAGILVAPIYKVYSTMGARVGEKALTAAILGGFGDVRGAMLGGILLGLIETFGSLYLTSAYKDALSFGVLIIVLVFMPQGILGGKRTTKV